MSKDVQKLESYLTEQFKLENAEEYYEKLTKEELELSDNQESILAYAAKMDND